MKKRLLQIDTLRTNAFVFIVIPIFGVLSLNMHVFDPAKNTLVDSKHSDKLEAKTADAYLSSEILHGHHRERAEQNIKGAVSRSSHAVLVFPFDSTQLLYNSIFFIWRSTGVEYYTITIESKNGDPITSYLTLDTTFYISSVSIDLKPNKYRWTITELDFEPTNQHYYHFEVLDNESVAHYQQKISEYQNGLWKQSGNEQQELLFYSMHRLSMQTYWYYAIQDDITNDILIQKLINQY